jgi:hypothetical protein
MTRVAFHLNADQRICRPKRPEIYDLYSWVKSKNKRITLLRLN